MDERRPVALVDFEAVREQAACFHRGRVWKHVVVEKYLTACAEPVTLEGELTDVLAGKPSAVERRRRGAAAEDEGADGQVDLVDQAGFEHREVQLTASFQQEVTNPQGRELAKDLDQVDAPRAVVGNDFDPGVPRRGLAEGEGRKGQAMQT